MQVFRVKKGKSRLSDKSHLKGKIVLERTHPPASQIEFVSPPHPSPNGFLEDTQAQPALPTFSVAGLGVGGKGEGDWRLVLTQICMASALLPLRCYRSIKIAKLSKGCL